MRGGIERRAVGVVAQAPTAVSIKEDTMSEKPTAEETETTRGREIGIVAIVAVVIGAIVLIAWALGAFRMQAAVTGTVTYRERIALPADAVVNVQLQDVSLADAPAMVVGVQVIETEGKQVPIPYKVEYDSDAIVENHSYAVRAEIRDGTGKLLFTTTSVHPVITRGNPTKDVEIVVQKVG
jgi:putative lipoprotein